MVFWTGILVGGFFVWLGVKRGFYEMWTMLFNVVVSVYTAIYLTPVIVDTLPGAGDTSYGTAFTLTALAVGLFFVLGITSLTLFTGRFKVAFPKMLDNLGAAVLGFLGGLLIWSFIALVISASPAGRTDFAGSIGFGSKFAQTNGPYISWWCDLINTAAASSEHRTSAEEAMGQLLAEPETDPSGLTDPNQPTQQVESNESPVVASPNRPL
ncbi:MAG: CvpA family protein [Planctomycetota bacterium]|jgi:hypothetical protein